MTKEQSSKIKQAANKIADMKKEYTEAGKRRIRKLILLRLTQNRISYMDLESPKIEYGSPIKIEVRRIL